MSKYARTRKAICRISKLSNWIVSKTYFRKCHIDTWREAYKKYRKYLVRNNFTLKSRFPCKYREGLTKYPDIWNVIR